jgi:FKBP-type peptidyl-prolyl cis-trans isomerase
MMTARQKTRLTTIASLLLLSMTAVAEDGMPALLQFAEQYHTQANTPPASTVTQEKTRVQTRSAKSTSPSRTSDTLTMRQTLRQREQQLTQQRIVLHNQTAELTKLREALKTMQARESKTNEVPTKTVDLSPLQQLVGGLYQAVKATPNAQQQIELLRQAQQQTKQDQMALAQSQEQVGMITRQLTELQARLNEKVEDLKMQRSSSQQQVSRMNERLEQLTRDKQQLEDDVSNLRAQTKWLPKPDTLKQPKGRLAYAAGTALGRDIIGLLEERQILGISVDRQIVLAGVTDAFSGQYQLASDILARALAESESTIRTAQELATADQIKIDEAYMATFSKQHGAKQSPSGFWYKVDYAGDTPIAGDAIVDVVVKESLTDGTVIQDMDLMGNVLSQPLSAYPPLFREAIKLLKNHGSLTLVVPPNLAYGEAGYLPKVPPNAMMVYVLRIEDSKAAQASSPPPFPQGRYWQENQRQQRCFAHEKTTTICN